MSAGVSGLQYVGLPPLACVHLHACVCVCVCVCPGMQAGPLCSTVQISLCKDMPVSVAFDLSDSNGCLRYFLAPKIDDEEDEGMQEDESKPV